MKERPDSDFWPNTRYPTGYQRYLSEITCIYFAILHTYGDEVMGPNFYKYSISDLSFIFNLIRKKGNQMSNFFRNKSNLLVGSWRIKVFI